MEILGGFWVLGGQGFRAFGNYGGDKPALRPDHHADVGAPSLLIAARHSSSGCLYSVTE